MKLKAMLFLLAVLALFSLTACNKEPEVETFTLTGEYSEEFGKNKDVYTTKVVVTVEGDVITKVEMAEDSNHYTKESSKWASTQWTDAEAEILKSFEGKTIAEVQQFEDGTSADLLVAKATVTLNRVYKAVLNALASK